MGAHPLNLLVRFVLEIAALLALGWWGWRQTESWARFPLALGLPLVAAAIWGTFAVVGDPSRSGTAPIPVPGVVRLGLELLLFATASWTLYDLNARSLAWALGIATTAHYALSHDRVLWLLSQ